MKLYQVGAEQNQNHFQKLNFFVRGRDLARAHDAALDHVSKKLPGYPTEVTWRLTNVDEVGDVVN